MKNLKQITKLIQNELIKGFFQRKTLVFIFFLLFCVFMCVAFNSSEDGEDWRESTKERIDNLNEEIQETENILMDESVDEMEQEFRVSLLEMQIEELEIQEFRLKNNIPEYVITPLKFVYKCKALFFLIAIFMAVFSANIIANEYNWGTIRQLFIKPVSRTKLFFIKYISTVIVTILLSAVLLISAIFLGYIFYGKNSTSIYEVIVNNGNIEMENMLISILQTTAINIFVMFVLNAISICMASVLRSNLLAILIALGTWGIGAFVGEFVKDSILYQYFLTPNLALSGYLPGGMIPYSGGTIGKSIIICLIYMVVMLMVGRYFFAKRDVY